MHHPARGGLVAIGVAVAVIVGLDVRHLTEIGPWPRTISHHGLGPDGWIFAAAVYLIAAGSTGIAVSLFRRGLAPAGAVAVLGLWTLGLALVAWFPKTDWSVGPSVGGSVHRVGSVIAFASLPVAALLISRYGRGRAGSRALALLGAGSLLWVLGITCVMIYAGFNDLRWYRLMPLDLVERGMALTEITTLAALGLYGAARPRAAAPIREPVTTAT